MLITNRKTKIVCTIGPASSHPDTIRELIRKGMNVARLNFSHGTHDTHREMIHLIRKIAAEEGTYVGILQDLCGPKIRLGMLPDKGVDLVKGEEIAICGTATTYENGIFPLSYPNLAKEIKPGESILLSDGLMELKVLRIEGENVICSVINGGRIFSRKGANMPNTNLKVSAFSAKDEADFIMGLAEEVDFVALSFVRSESDLAQVRKMISDSEHKPLLIAKIEKPQAVENLPKILKKVDGVMVARGDLGVETPLEKVPMLQKLIISSARDMGKIVITATQMLMSMVANPRPTRSETSDVANAILDGTDAIMLSDESASGEFPVQACEMMAKIAAATEPYAKSSFMGNPSIRMTPSISLAVGRAACWLAEDIEASAIIAYTQSGFTARGVSQFRPSCPILGLATLETTCRQLTLIHGVTPILTQKCLSTDFMFSEALKVARDAGVAKDEDQVVLTAGVPMGKRGSTDLVRVLTLESE